MNISKGIIALGISILFLFENSMDAYASINYLRVYSCNFKGDNYNNMGGIAVGKRNEKKGNNRVYSIKSNKSNSKAILYECNLNGKNARKKIINKNLGHVNDMTYGKYSGGYGFFVVPLNKKAVFLLKPNNYKIKKCKIDFKPGSIAYVSNLTYKHNSVFVLTEAKYNQKESGYVKIKYHFMYLKNYRFYKIRTISVRIKNFNKSDCKAITYQGIDVVNNTMYISAYEYKLSPEIRKNYIFKVSKVKDLCMSSKKNITSNAILTKLGANKNSSNDFFEIESIAKVGNTVFFSANEVTKGIDTDFIGKINC